MRTAPRLCAGKDCKQLHPAIYARLLNGVPVWVCKLHKAGTEPIPSPVRAQDLREQKEEQPSCRHAICGQCTPNTALVCPACGTLCCTHYSLWAADDPCREKGVQLVHRCNECQSVLVEYEESAYE